LPPIGGVRAATAVAVGEQHVVRLRDHALHSEIVDRAAHVVVGHARDIELSRSVVARVEDGFEALEASAEELAGEVSTSAPRDHDLARYVGESLRTR
jgi:hypothetical protein